MKLSLQTDLALRTLLYLATHTGRSTVAAIASYYDVSVHHLGKVAFQLGRLGWVRNQRGSTGGILLDVSARDVTVGAVVRAFEGRSTHLLDCVDTAAVCVIQPGCLLRHVLIEAERRQMDFLDEVTLRQLLPGSGDLDSFRKSISSRTKSAARRK